MYSGTMIEDLIKTVQHAEESAGSRKCCVVRKPAANNGLQAFFYQMQSMTQVHAGMA